MKGYEVVYRVCIFRRAFAIVAEEDRGKGTSQGKSRSQKKKRKGGVGEKQETGVLCRAGTTSLPP